jgi:GT2 family glycosyltransferase
MKFTILIVNWNSADSIATCLESIRDHANHLNPQVIVIDSGSFDGCADMLGSRFPDVEFMQSPANIGFGRSNNLGFTRATGEWLLLLNPDTVLRAGAVEALMNALETRPQAWIAGARLCRPDGAVQRHSVHRLPTPWRCATDSEWSRRRDWRFLGLEHATAPVEVEAVSGACMMMRSSIFRRLGGFDPGFFMYAEDMDLCLRIHRQGGRILHVPQAVVVHQGGACSPGEARITSAITMRESLDRYFRIHHGRGHVLLHHLASTATSLLRLATASWSEPDRRSEITAVRRAVVAWSLRIPRFPRPSAQAPRILFGSTPDRGPTIAATHKPAVIS